MVKKVAIISLALVAGILAACGGRGSAPMGGMGGTSYALPPMGDLAINATLPKNAIGEDLPSVLGKRKSLNAMIGGFTQTHYSQTLAFPPGTKLTIQNLSKDGTDHTFNVIMEVTGRSVRFPRNPQAELQTSAHGHGKLEAGYRSGVIMAGHSVTVTLVKEGTYLVGCAFHYVSNGMRDVIVVRAGARPGPQATPPAATPSPAPTKTGGGGGWDRPN